MLQDLSLLLLCYESPLFCDVSKEPEAFVLLGGGVVVCLALFLLRAWWRRLRQTEQGKSRKECR